MFLWPSTTPGSVCTSTSCNAARCVSAKLRIWVCANLMSSITPDGKARTHSAISLSESLKDGGDHLSNFSEYSRTAASPRAAMSARIASTVLRTCALFSAFASADCPVLRWRIMACSPNQFCVAQCTANIEVAEIPSRPLDKRAVYASAASFRPVLAFSYVRRTGSDRNWCSRSFQRLQRLREKVDSKGFLVAQALLPSRVLLPLSSMHSQEWMCYSTF